MMSTDDRRPVLISYEEEFGTRGLLDEDIQEVNRQARQFGEATIYINFAI